MVNYLRFEDLRRRWGAFRFGLDGLKRVIKRTAAETPEMANRTFLEEKKELLLVSSVASPIVPETSASFEGLPATKGILFVKTRGIPRPSKESSKVTTLDLGETDFMSPFDISSMSSIIIAIV
jgi:hypothetical protein